MRNSKYKLAHRKAMKSHRASKPESIDVRGFLLYLFGTRNERPPVRGPKSRSGHSLPYAAALLLLCLIPLAGCHHAAELAPFEITDVAESGSAEPVPDFTVDEEGTREAGFRECHCADYRAELVALQHRLSSLEMRPRSQEPAKPEPRTQPKQQAFTESEAFQRCGPGGCGPARGVFGRVFGRR